MCGGMEGGAEAEKDRISCFKWVYLCICDTILGRIHIWSELPRYALGQIYPGCLSMEQHGMKSAGRIFLLQKLKV